MSEGRRALQAVSRPSPRKGPVVAWGRGILRSRPSLDEIFSRLIYLGAAMRPGRVPLHRSEGLRPVFILGAGRSGNTLLRRILAAGGEIHIPPETYVLGTVISLFRRTQHLGWGQQVRLTLAQFEFHPEFEDFGVHLSELAGRLSELSPKRRSLAAMLDGLYRFHAEAMRSSASRWGDKTPLNVYSLDRIRAVFPDALFVHMVRDGVDVVASYLRADLTNNVEAAAERWRSSLRAAEAFQIRHPQTWLEVRYEALVSDPENEARRVADFVGLRFSAEMVDELSHLSQLGDVSIRPYHEGVHQPVHTNSVGAGRRESTAESLQAMQRIIGPTLQRWSYPPAV
jgi:LPS sulfotransferase NodH